ncbi:MAG TPA: FecR domain-containing protein [Leptospiraceae bacterium]|nr:FecR domain-containing protein [Leptospiraceae bacterium]HMZ59131.1 FecR domain-containing protein [Leptospiraceae bacterium]HNN06295.1 FecR domain-containing protein [Leptospiraceae bacterium]
MKLYFIILLLYFFFNCASSSVKEEKKKNSELPIISLPVKNERKPVPGPEPKLEKRTQNQEESDSLNAVYRGKKDRDRNALYTEFADKNSLRPGRVISEKEYVLNAAAKAVIVQGDVFSFLSPGKERKVTPGSLIYDGEIIRTGERSFCELEAVQSSGFRIKISRNTVFKMSANLNNNGDNPVLGYGRISVKVKKESEGFRSATPNWMAGVRGTEFDLVQSENESRIFLWEGRLQLSPYIPERELLGPKNSLEDLIHTNQVDLKGGEKIQLSRDRHTQFFNESGLNSVLTKAGQSGFSAEAERFSRNEDFRKKYLSYMDEARRSIRPIAEEDRTEPESRDCSSSSLPKELIDKCSDTHVLLAKRNKSEDLLYNYLLLAGDNYLARLRAYDFFIKNCDEPYQPAIEKMQEILKNRQTDKIELEYAEKTLEKFKFCSGQP